MVHMQEVRPIKERVADVCSRYVLLRDADIEDNEVKIAEARRLMASILEDIPVQKCLSVSDALAAVSLATAFLMDFVDQAEQVERATPTEAGQYAIDHLAIIGMVLERSIQGLEDATGENANQYAWRDRASLLQHTHDA